jgi:hypothetical protein
MSAGNFSTVSLSFSRDNPKPGRIQTLTDDSSVTMITSIWKLEEQNVLKKGGGGCPCA